MKAIEKAIKNAVILTNKFHLPPQLVSYIMDGRLHYSVALCPQNDGVCVEIDRASTSLFATVVQAFEEATELYVYHCILTGPFLTLLFTSEDGNDVLTTDQEEIPAAVYDVDKQEQFFTNVRLASCGDALVRID